MVKDRGNCKMIITGKKLAVLIGSQGRGLSETSRSINLFLKMFDVDYDIYVCTDEEYLHDFDSYLGDNIREMKSWESLVPQEDRNYNKPGPDQKLNLIKKCSRHNLYQWHKLCLARDMMIKNITEYDAVIKIRTDMSFDYMKMIASLLKCDKEKVEASQSNIDLIKYQFNEMYRCVVNHRPSFTANPPSVFRNGDKVVFGNTKTMDTWSNLSRYSPRLNLHRWSYMPFTIRDYNDLPGYPLTEICYPKKLFSHCKSRHDISDTISKYADELKEKYTKDLEPPNVWRLRDDFTPSKDTPVWFGDLISDIHLMYIYHHSRIETGPLFYYRLSKYFNEPRLHQFENAMLVNI